MTLRPGDDPDAVLIAASVTGSGWPVLAIRTGTKQPLHSGSATANHRDRWLTSPAAVVAAYEESADDRDRRTGCQYAVMTGQPSDGLNGLALVAIDVDGAPNALAALLAEAGPETEQWAADTLRVQRPDAPDRMHLYGTVNATECPQTGDLASGLEWRGSTGYVLLPGALHPDGERYAVTGGRYEFTAGHQPDAALYVGLTEPDDDDPTVLAVWVHPLPVPDVLLEVVRTRSSSITPPQAPRPGGRTTEEVRALLAPREPADHGQPDSGGVPELVKPTLDTGPVGSVERRLAGLMRAVTEAERGHGNNTLNWAAGKSAAICASSAGDADEGEVRAALVAAYMARPIPAGESARTREAGARATVASGWSWGAAHPAEALTDRDTPHASKDNPEDGDDPVTLRSVNDTPQGSEPSGSDVVPHPYRDLSTLATTRRMPDRPRPEFLARADGSLSLFYRGKVNRLFGRPENGKTWLPVAAGSELLRGPSGRYAHLDLDHMGDEIVRRLVLFGVPWEILGNPARFRLYEPTDRHEMLAAVADLVAWVPDLVALDSVGELLPLVGANSNDPDDLTAANRRYVQPIADAGSGVLLLDHMTKYAGDGDGPTGTDAKGRPIRGASYHVRTVREFAPGRGGAVRLALEKDTSGSVRTVLAEEQARKVAGRRVAGEFCLHPVGEDPDAPGSLRWSLERSTWVDVPAGLSAEDVEVIDDRKDSEAAERLSRALETCGGNGWLVQSENGTRAKVRKADVGRLLSRLAAGGYIERRPGTRKNSVQSRSVKPYREGETLPPAPEDETGEEDVQ